VFPNLVKPYLLGSKTAGLGCPKDIDPRSDGTLLGTRRARSQRSLQALPIRHGENAERAQVDPDQSGGRIWQAGDRGNWHLDCGCRFQVQCPGIHRRSRFRIWRQAAADRRSNPLGAEDGRCRCLSAVVVNVRLPGLEKRETWGTRCWIVVVWAKTAGPSTPLLILFG